MVASGVHKRLLERPRPGSARRADASFAGTRVSAATVRTGDGSPQAARIGCSGRRRTVTSRPTLQTDIRNAGGAWVNTDVRVVAGLVASRTPHDIPAFNAKMIEEFAERTHTKQREKERAAR
jgi:putative intracellular protease/amidase